jgi:hypothetical protein
MTFAVQGRILAGGRAERRTMGSGRRRKWRRKGGVVGRRVRKRTGRRKGRKKGHGKWQEEGMKKEREQW